MMNASNLEEVMWPCAWAFSEAMLMWRPSRMPGRGDKIVHEDFYGEAPDVNKLPVLPFGQPVEYRTPKGQKADQFSEKCVGLH